MVPKRHPRDLVSLTGSPDWQSASVRHFVLGPRAGSGALCVGLHKTETAPEARERSGGLSPTRYKLMDDARKVAHATTSDPSTDPTLEIQASALAFAADLAAVRVHAQPGRILFDAMPGRGRATYAASAVRAVKRATLAYLLDTHTRTDARIASALWRGSPTWWTWPDESTQAPRVLRCGLWIGGAR